MAGVNQHHIPQLLQRAFGVPRKGKSTHIWSYPAVGEPACDTIKNTASEPYFYSQPSDDGSPTLDDKITETESDLATTIQGMWAMPGHTAVDSTIASNLVMSLAPRSGHIRSAIASGVKQIVTTAIDLFSNRDAVEQMMGLDQDQPNPVFNEKLGSALADEPLFNAIGLPQPIMERLGFYLAKESFNADTGGTIPQFTTMLEQWADGSAEMAKGSHVKALSKTDEESERRTHIAGFDWTIEDGPEDGAILPDCVAIAETMEGTTPLLFAGPDARLVVMPVSRSKLLVGRQTLGLAFDPGTFNAKAASCSHSFFLASVDDPKLRELTPTIGEQSKEVFDKSIKEATDSFKAVVIPDDGSPTEPLTLSTWREGNGLSFAMHYLGCATEEQAAEIGDALKGLVVGLAPVMPLGRLADITFADDYPNALREIDRGHPDWPPVETVSEEIGIGVARTVSILRDGQVKAHIVFRGYVAQMLMSTDDQEMRWGLHTVVYQLAKVAWLDLIDHALGDPASLTITDPLQTWLFPHADVAIQAYHCAFTSAAFSDGETMAATYRELFVEALARVVPSAQPVKTEVYGQESAQPLLVAALTAIEFPLQHMAALLGHCQALGLPILDEEGTLAAALEAHGLTHWPATYRRDLERVRIKQGQWESIDELLTISRHTERLLWSVRVFPWISPEGPRVEYLF